MNKLELLIISILSFFILALSFYPVYYRYKTTPPDRIYVGTTYFTEDYAGYVSVIEQGIKGRWSAIDKFTSEKTPATYIYYPYLLLGHIAGIFNISSIQMYQLSRFVFALFYLISIYYLIRCVIGSTAKRIVAFILVTFSSSFPILNNGIIDVPVISRIVGEVQAVNRLVIQPHYLLGNIILILLFSLLIKYLDKPRFLYLFVTGILIFLTTFFRPFNMLLFLCATGVYWLFCVISTRKLNIDILLLLLINGIMSFPGYLYLENLKLSYPGLPYFQFDLDKSRLFEPTDWLLIQGPVLIFSVLSLWKTKKAEFSKITLLITIFLVNIGLTFIMPIYYYLNPIRTIQTPLFVILAILAAIGIFKISKNLTIITIITIITILISLPTAILDFQHEIKLYRDAYYIWPPKNYVPAFNYLNKNTSPDDMVLTYQSLSNLIPMMSGNTVYWGHTNETINYDLKQKILERFYAGSMSLNEAQKFLKDNGIKYVLVGREEKGIGQIPDYFFLKSVFVNLDIEIFKVL